MKQKSAFTLMEILIVVAIMGVIAVTIILSSRPAIEKISYRKLSFTAYNFLRTTVGSYIAEHKKITDSKQLCEYIASMSNTTVTNPENIHSDCTGVVVDDDFNASNANFTLNNGMAFFNFGKAIHNAVYDMEDNLTQGYYIVYVDIDGNRGKRILNKDVIGFLININGEVLPYGDAAVNKDYFLAEYKFLRINPEDPAKYEWVWLDRNSNFKEAICKAGIELQTNNYCGGIESVCTTRICRYQIIK